MNIKKSPHHKQFYVRNGQLFEIMEKNGLTTHNLILDCPSVENMDAVNQSMLESIAKKHHGFQRIKWRIDEVPPFVHEVHGTMVSEKVWAIGPGFDLTLCSYNEHGSLRFWYDIVEDEELEAVLYWCSYHELLPKSVADKFLQKLETQN